MEGQEDGGLREENNSGGRILGFAGERKQCTGSDRSGEQKDWKENKAMKLMGRETFVVLKRENGQKAIEEAEAAEERNSG